jgi:tetratricopeptide (TPR) repeat protein
LLQALAVIGLQFPLALVSAVVRKPDDELRRMLEILQLGEFIYEQPAVADTEYVFKHALTREVAYNSVLLERRRLVHEQIARAIESLFADRLDDHLKDLAHHYRRSTDTLKAVEFLRRAGEQAVARGFYDEAIELLNSALASLEKLNASHARDVQELAIRTALMGCLIAARSLISPEIELNSERLKDLCERSGETRNLAQVLTHLFFFHRSATSREKAGTFARRALEPAEASRGEVEIFCGNFISGMLAAERTEYLAARQHLERAVGISQQAQELILSYPSVALGFLNCTGYLAIVCWVLGYPDRAQRHCERLAELLRRSLSVDAYAIGAFHLLTMRCDFFRDYQGVRAEALEALDRVVQGGFGWGVAFTTLRLANIMVTEGAADAGLEKFAEVLTTHETAVDPHYTYWLTAGVYLKARRVTEGRAILEKAMTGIASGDSQLYETELYRIKGELALIGGETLGDPEAAFKLAIAIARQQQAKSYELRATMSLARLLRDTNRDDEARTMLSDIYNRFTEGFDTADLKDAKALLDELNHSP